MLKRFVEIDNHKYVVASATYTRKWSRLFDALINTVGVRLNWVDRGPGLKIFAMTLILNNWPPDSQPYKDIYATDPSIASLDTQRHNLELSYRKIAKSLQFKDPFGEPPSENMGVFFSDLTQIIPIYSTVQHPYVLMSVELTEATQLIN